MDYYFMSSSIFNVSQKPSNITISSLSTQSKKKKRKRDEQELLSCKIPCIDTYVVNFRKANSKLEKIMRYAPLIVDQEKITIIFFELINKQLKFKTTIHDLFSEMNWSYDRIIAIPNKNPEIYVKWKTMKIKNAGLNEQFAYQCALILDLTDIATPTKLMKVNGRKIIIQQCLLEDLQPDPDSVSMNQYINALVYELFLGLLDSHRNNIIVKNQNFVHFDCELAPENTRKNTDFSERCYLLSLKKAINTLSSENIIHFKNLLEKIKICFPKIKELATDTLGVRDWKYWEERVDRMFKNFEEIQNGNITTMMDYHFACMPSIKSKAYFDIWSYIADLDINSFNEQGCLSSNDMASVQKYVSIPNGPDSYFDSDSDSDDLNDNFYPDKFLHLSYQDFVNHCAKLRSDYLQLRK